MSFPQSLRNVCKRNAKKQLDIDLIVSGVGSPKYHWEYD